jgi:hypothetical protein
MKLCIYILSVLISIISHPIVSYGEDHWIYEQKKVEVKLEMKNSKGKKTYTSLDENNEYSYSPIYDELKLKKFVFINWYSGYGLRITYYSDYRDIKKKDKGEVIFFSKGIHLEQNYNLKGPPTFEFSPYLFDLLGEGHYKFNVLFFDGDIELPIHEFIFNTGT